MDQATVTLVNQLTLSAAAIIACSILWRAYKQSHDDHIKDLRGHIATFNLRLGLIEDRLSMPTFDGGSFAGGESRFPEKKELKPIGDHGLD